jgi:glycosyltransferase involved in cell wall biosynthesis
MPRRAIFSLIVPTRKRTDKLRRFLASIAETTADIDAIEVILVIDADDSDSREFQFDRVPLKRVLVAPGLPMGTLNQAGYAASAGDHVMLLNDDVIARTSRWDKKIISCLRRFPDEILLVHVNDTLFKQGMCTFPMVSRTYCRLAGVICPADYLRYRIDDHIEQVFNLLGVLGEKRIAYFPDIVFEHDKYEERTPGRRRYFLDKSIEALDAPRFHGYFPARKELAVKLKRYIASQRGQPVDANWTLRLDRVDDVPGLRPQGRFRRESTARRLMRLTGLAGD